MKKPYIICHMMISLDGRIDCAMTSRLCGVDDYYTTLEEIDVPTTVSGRVTAELEMAEPVNLYRSMRKAMDRKDIPNRQMLQAMKW